MRGAEQVPGPTQRKFQNDHPLPATPQEPLPDPASHRMTFRIPMALQEVAVQSIEEGQEGSKATSLERQLPNKREVVRVALCTWPSTPLASTDPHRAEPSMTPAVKGTAHLVNTFCAPGLGPQLPGSCWPCPLAWRAWCPGSGSLTPSQAHARLAVPGRVPPASQPGQRLM